MGISSNFPSTEERTAAAALLLLRTFSNPPFPRHYCSSSSSDEISSTGGVMDCSSDEDEEEVPPQPLSSSSSSGVSDSSSALICRGEVQHDPLLLLALAARCMEPNRKVVRNARSRVQHGDINPSRKQRSLLWHGFGSWKGEMCEMEKEDDDEDDHEADDDDNDAASSTITSSRTSSTLATTSSTGGSSSRRYFLRRLPTRDLAENKRKKSGEREVRRNAHEYWSAGVTRQAESILKLLRERGCASEVAIRVAVGNSPDTSKALRMLLRLQDVRRSGGGGRADPFLYRAARQFDDVVSV